MNNLDRIRIVARRLGPLREHVVFLGGATVGLLLTDAAASAPRPTNDVDLILPVATRVELWEIVHPQLRELGFQEDTDEDAPICRWTVDGVKVDFMPPESDILGFSNRWYPSAVQTADTYDLDPGLSIRLVTAPHFMATKLEAFYGRGAGDFQASHDLEDIIALIDGRASIVEDIAAASPDLQGYLSAAMGKLLSTPAFVDALPGHLLGDDASQRRLPLIIARLERVAGLP